MSELGEQIEALEGSDDLDQAADDPVLAGEQWWIACVEPDGSDRWHWACAHERECRCADREYGVMPACGETEGFTGDTRPTSEVPADAAWCDACLLLARNAIAEQDVHPPQRRSQSLADAWPAAAIEIETDPDDVRSAAFPVAPAVCVEWEREGDGMFVVTVYDAETDELVASIFTPFHARRGTGYLYGLPGRVYVHPVAPGPWKLRLSTLDVELATLPFPASGHGYACTAPVLIDGPAIIETAGGVRSIDLLDPADGVLLERLVPRIPDAPIPVVGDGGPYALAVNAEGEWTVRIKSVTGAGTRPN